MSDITKENPEIDLSRLVLIAGGHNAFQLLWAGVELELFTLLSQEPGLSLEQITMMLEKFAEMPMRQPIKADEGETKGFLPRRDSAAILGALEDMQAVEATEEEDNSDYGTSTNTRRS